MSKQAVERVLQVFEALVQSARGLRREELRWLISDYRKAPNDSAFERMFERDKATLRNIGILESQVTDDGMTYLYRLKDQNLQQARQQLETAHDDKSSLAVLAWAMLIFRKGAAQKTADAVLAKLGWTQKSAEKFFGPQKSLLEIPEDIFTIIRALVHHKSLIFTYRDLAGELSEKEASIWGLGNRFGRWYAAGGYKNSSSVRVFRIDRMEKLSLGETAAEPQSNFSMTEVLARLSKIPPRGLECQQISEDKEISVIPAYSFEDALFTVNRLPLKVLPTLSGRNYSEFQTDPSIQHHGYELQRAIIEKLYSSHGGSCEELCLNWVKPSQHRKRASAEIQIFTLFGLLQLTIDNPGITYKELSERSGFSVAEVKKQMNFLLISWGSSLLDIEIIEDRVYAYFSGQQLSTFEFSSEELFLMLVALQFLEGTSLSSQVLESAMKQWSLLGSNLREWQTAFTYLHSEPQLPHLQTAIDNGDCMEIIYTQGGRSEERKVRPFELFQQQSLHYLVAFCYSRQASRIFRLDRMSILGICTEPTPDVDREQPTLTPQQWSDRLKEDESLVALRVHHELSPEITALLQQSVVEETASHDWSAIKIAYSSSDWVWDLLLKAQGDIEVLAPVELRHEIFSRAQHLRFQVRGNTLP